MGFNLHFADADHRPARKRAPRPSRKIWLLPLLGLCLAASITGDLLLASGRYSGLLVSDASAGIVAGRHALRTLVYGH
jgi:paraquat-inducible protein B